MTGVVQADGRQRRGDIRNDHPEAGPVLLDHAYELLYSARQQAVVPQLTYVRNQPVPTITIVLRDGTEQVVAADTGVSLMEAIRNAGIDELLALCGGCCSCATCHVKIEPSHETSIPPMSDDENELLDSSEHRDSRSRLSCQVQLTAALDRIRVIIAEED